MSQIDEHTLSGWAENLTGPVALCLKEPLLPVAGEGAVVFPPTYAGGDYCISQLPDGTFVAQMDSVGSQANRMEPLFKSGPLAALVPQVTINAAQREVNLLDVGHRLADALVRCSEGKDEVKAAFDALQSSGNAEPIAKLAPTTLVFGAWNSRDDAGMKIPRLVSSVIRAWGAARLHRSAQYNPPLDYSQLEVFSEAEKQKEEGDDKSPLAKRGFVHVPAVDKPGGILAEGGIRREVILNLIPLRALQAQTSERGAKLRAYILGLALVAATTPQDGYLRQGCLLTADPDNPARWEAVDRSGKRTPVELTHEAALTFAKTAAHEFGVGPARQFKFNKKFASEDIAEARKKDKEKKDKKGKAAEAGA